MKSRNWPIIGAVLAAVGASICCVGPLVLLALGVSGAWIGSLGAFERYRPLFMLVALTFLGFGFYRVYRKAGPASCKEGQACARPGSGRGNKVALWAATLLVIGLFAYPNIAAYLAASGSAAEAGRTGPTEQVVLEVEGMTCAGCVATVTKSLKKLEGVEGVEVTLDPPWARVVYDPARTELEEMTAATTKAGYPSHRKGTTNE